MADTFVRSTTKPRSGIFWPSIARVPSVLSALSIWSWSPSEQSPGQRARLTDATAAALFRGLGASVREVDFVGWYQEGHVPAAVLAQGVKPSDGVAGPSIADRVRGELNKGLTLTELQNLRVRVVRLGGATK